MQLWHRKYFDPLCSPWSGEHNIIVTFFLFDAKLLFLHMKTPTQANCTLKSDPLLWRWSWTLAMADPSYGGYDLAMVDPSYGEP